MRSQMEETMEKYRILQIHNFYQIPGGEDVVVRNEKKLLEEHGHEVFTYYRSNKELNEGNKLKKLFIPFTAVYSLKKNRYRACAQYPDDGESICILCGISV